ncbi:MAG: porin family protein [Gammaproteobacteria bacterium]|nr:porin family protein [Gammaproteobacteria bacterium]
MKKTLLIACSSLLMVIGTAHAVDVGIGASVNTGEEASSYSISVPIRTSALLIEPDIMISSYTSDSTDNITGITSDQSNSYTSIGVGLFARIPLTGVMGAYAGGRLGYINSESESNYITSSNTRESSGYSVGPAVGLSYAVNDSFNVSVQTGLYYHSVTEDVETVSSAGVVVGSSSTDREYTNTISQIYLRMFF